MCDTLLWQTARLRFAAAIGGDRAATSRCEVSPEASVGRGSWWPAQWQFGAGRG